MLLATDLSSTSTRAEDEAIRLAASLRARLIAVSIIDPRTLRLPSGRFRTRIDQFCPAQEKVDTMEFRATDRQLYDYGFGPL